MSVTAKELLAKKIDPITYVVDGLFPQGLLVLAGPPKLGKSYLVNQLGLAVASGNPILGRDVTQGSVLYYALEDGEGRLQERLRQQLQDARGMERMTYELHARRLGDGFEDAIRTWHAETPDARLVIVDTLIGVARGPKGRQDPYEHWSDLLASPRELARDLKIGILFVHHARKGSKSGDADGDVFDGIYGSVGVFGTADAGYVLQRHRMSSDAVLVASGRDVKEIAIKIRRNETTMTWHATGGTVAPELLGATSRQWDVFDALAGGPLRNADVAAKLGTSDSNANQLLKRAVKDGYVVQVERGPYALHGDVARMVAEADGDGSSQPAELNEEAEEIDFGL